MNEENKYSVSVPEGKSGAWEVKRFTVSKEDASLEMIRGMMHDGRYTPAGNYTGLFHNHSIVMSDTPAEIRDHHAPIFRSRGFVLINGLGLGVVLQAIARREDVKSVTVVEKSGDVINLVWPHYAKMFGKKIEIVHGDAFKFTPPKGKRYGFVWHDIWDSICANNLPEMRTLHRKYGRRAEQQGSWCRYQCERYAGMAR